MTFKFAIILGKLSNKFVFLTVKGKDYCSCHIKSPVSDSVLTEAGKRGGGVSDSVLYLCETRHNLILRQWDGTDFVVADIFGRILCFSHEGNTEKENNVNVVFQ